MSGSELSVRTLVALVGAPLLIGATILGGTVFFFVVGVIVLRSVWELARVFTKAEESAPVRVVGIAGSLALLVDAWLWRGAHWGWLLLAGGGLILIVEVFRSHDSQPTAVVGGTITSWIYVAVPLAHLLWLRGAPGIAGTPSESSAWLVVALWSIVWIADTVAYFVGSALGRRKLMPAVSPGKTWEGTIAGLLAGCLIGAVMAAAVAELEWSIFLGLGIGFFLGIVAVAGDLVESRLKRGAGLKDTGDALPGHGGFLDRFDSTIFSAPALYYLLIVRQLL